MAPEGKATISMFITGLNAGLEQLIPSAFTPPFYFTLLADCMQIQCLLENKLDLLEFRIPSKLNEALLDITRARGARVDTYSTDTPGIYYIKFGSEDDQDLVIQTFEMMSFQGRRAYPCPDIYLGKPEVDKEVCDAILGIIFKLFID